jgi:hypothetical protein
MAHDEVMRERKRNVNLCCNERNKDEWLRQARKRECDYFFFFIEQIVVFLN